VKKKSKSVIDELGLTMGEIKDLSKKADLGVGLMQLVSIEHHLAFTIGKVDDVEKKKKYMAIYEKVRKVRTSLLKKLITNYEGEVWCCAKHLLQASESMLEVGTKTFDKPDEAIEYFDLAWELFQLLFILQELGGEKGGGRKKRD